MQYKDEEESLKSQVQEIMDGDQFEQPERQERQERQERKAPVKEKKKKKKGLRNTILTLLILLLLILAFILLTKPGRKILYGVAGNFIYKNMDTQETMNNSPDEKITHSDLARQEDYVTNYLIFGIEEFGGARNTDSMMIASINTKDNTIKLTSLLRDSYVEIPGYKNNKLNAAYSRGGAKKLIETVEHNYRVQIEGYASVDFKSFEKIVNSLGGVNIELGEKEAKYLNRTNYISNKKYRNVKAGMNLMNGNQVMGYCRVRKVETLGGINNDYGRVVRQQRALNAIFDKLKKKNPFEQMKIVKEWLGYVTTNVSENQIEKALGDVVENKIKKLDTFRIPVDGAFDAPVKYNGIGYPIILDWDKNRVELYKFIFNDTAKEAKAILDSQ